MNDHTITGSSFSALILSSGLSERMGKPKALLMWDNNSTFIEKIINEYLKAGADKIVCTVNSVLFEQRHCIHSHPKVSFVLNEHPEWGRMYSIGLGMKEIHSDYCFIQNVDNPYIEASLIGRILEASDPHAWCSPEFLGKGGHPVLVPQAMFQHIIQEKNLDLTLQDFLSSLPRKKVVVKDRSILKNINSPADYRDFLEHQQ